MEETPLHLAVKFAVDGNDPKLGEKMVEVLCQAGCDTNLRDANGYTPADLIPEDEEDRFENIRNTLENGD